MISRAETGFALKGLLRVLRFDPTFPLFFDRSPSGAARSFWIYLLLIAWHFLALVLFRDPQQSAISGRMWCAFATTQAINALYFPVVLLAIGSYIDRAAHVVGCITIYNWLQLPSLALNIFLTLIDWLNFDQDAQLILNVVALCVVLLWEGFVLAVCLRISLFFAAAFVALDFVLGQMLFSFLHVIGTAPLF
jgi:hypothetical protein